ncbi:hypothetical protein G3570_09800 [Balneolaceae bacterium YR4-1]|uniref:Uncharacterized protein n=1 Tax=Halalkalibaculum roseum TaxID=2709311 RepID=A0A6M1SY95_9BACT|nr:hypothetical protein [Halalkalibaculum roseum]NGP76926.1 hypothetical protein [Halalkalibaculum roseum]
MDIKQAFFQIRILHAALFVGVILFAGISFAFHNFMSIGDSLVTLPDNAFYLVLLLAGLLLWLSYFTYRNRISKIVKGSSLKERIDAFRSAAILRVALVEAASLVVIMAYLLSGDRMYLIVAIAPLFFFISTFPKEDKMIETLELSYSEVQQLNE